VEPKKNRVKKTQGRGLSQITHEKRGGAGPRIQLGEKTRGLVKKGGQWTGKKPYKKRNGGMWDEGGSKGRPQSRRVWE